MSNVFSILPELPLSVEVEKEAEEEEELSREFVEEFVESEEEIEEMGGIEGRGITTFRTFGRHLWPSIIIHENGISRNVLHCQSK